MSRQPLLMLLSLALTVLSLCSAYSSSEPMEGSSNSNLPGVYIERAPESAVAPKGDEVVFECELNLKPDRLDWRYRQGSSDPYRYLHPAAGYNVTSSNEDCTWKLRIYVSAQTLGDYQCVAWYGQNIAIASTPARLTLVSISLDNANGYSRHAVRWSVAPKNCVLLRCGSVISNPPAIWSFYRNGEKLPQTEMLPGAAGALVLSSVGAADAGNYSCVATNAITGVEQRLPQVIDLRVDYTDRTPPYFLLQQPATQVAAHPGETVILECPGVGSPPPVAVWSSPTLPTINHNRTRVLAYGLQITDVRTEDQGSYVCRLDNGIAPVLVHMISLSVLQRPRILTGPNTTLTNEGDPITLLCTAVGHPKPEIYWLFNGEDASADNETLIRENYLHIQHVQKRHAGVIQCFARNQLGETSDAKILHVNPLQISGEDYQPLGNVPMRTGHDSANGNGGSTAVSSSSNNSNKNNFGGGGRNKGKRKFMRVANMVPPSRPNVTRLADDAVMLRWNVPNNDGLHIQFFKVQYRMLGDNARGIPRENWQTTNENIPYGKQRERERERERDRDRDNRHESTYAGVKNFTSSVTGLLPDLNYRFRIIAVYSNNDNKEGTTSTKFYLQRSGAKSNLPVPELQDVEPYSESAVLLHWTLSTVADQTHNIDGYYAYYRPAASAAEYLKATVDGAQTRKFKMDLLESGTAYEFKLQTFNAHAASEFSEIKQGRTLKIASKPSSATVPSMVAGSSAGNISEQQNSIYPVIAGAAGGGILLLIATVVACLCIRRRSSAQPEDENKPQLDHIQADFVSAGVLGVTPHHNHNHKAGDVRRLNGVIPRMNITPNPLAQDPSADKNNTLAVAAAVALHQPGLHHAQPYHAPGTPTLMQKRLPTAHDFQQLQAPPVPPHAAYYQHQPHAAPTSGASPMLDQQRRTLERSVRSLQHQQQQHHHQQHQAALGYGLEDVLPTATPARIPSLRRQRRTSGSQHNSHTNLNHHNNNNNISNNNNNNNNNNHSSNNNNLPHHLLHHQHHLHHLNHNGGNGSLVGIPIVPGSPRVQRSPMPARALIKRTRLGSHTDNISSGSLNSIEV